MREILGAPARRKVSVIATAITASVGALIPLTSPPAHADLVPYVSWSAALPGYTDEFIPTSENDCVAGRPQCLKHTLKDLLTIFERTAGNCTHDAVFSLAYLRITQTYGWSRDIPDYYDDVPFANHQDAVFARYYTDAYWNFQNGRLDLVPRSWQIAFEAARDKQVTATGDLLLGMNAHINRDLAFVVAAVGTVAPDGSSRKPDYVQVEHFLDLATAPMLAEAAARLDPTLDDANDPLGLGYGATFQLISSWRENAWRNAESLIAAATPAERAFHEQRIEAQAEEIANNIRITHAYTPPLSSTMARDAYCATHKDDAAPMTYPFGSPAPWGY